MCERCAVKIFSVVSVLFCLLQVHFASAQVAINPAQTAAVLAQKLAGPGVTILNPVLTCNPYAGGLFNITSTVMTLDSGVVLTTGSIYSVGGPAATNASTNIGTPGDPQLAQLANSTTYDDCKLEFDLIPKGDTIRFDYVFGSEEYNNATCGVYNDAFAFFISGPGITGAVNMARVPGTNIPVTVNSINNGIPGPGGNILNCTSMGPGSPFTAYYIDNSGGQMLTYRGFTTVLSAVHAVQPCGTYHLKLTIADAGNATYDSGVFLKAGSLKANTFSINASRGNVHLDTPVIADGCPPVTVTIRRYGSAGTSQSVKYLIGGTAVNGSDYTLLTDSVVIAASDTAVQFNISALAPQPNGPRTLVLRLLSPFSCGMQEAIDSVRITIADAPAFSILTPDTSICKGLSVPLRITRSAGLSFSWQPGGGLSGANIPAPVASPQTNTLYVAIATLPNSGCAPVKDSVQIDVVAPPQVSAGADITSCTGQSIQLNAAVIPANGLYTYSWNGPEGFASTSPSPTVTAVATASSGLYIVAVTDGVCTRADTVMLTVSPVPAKPAVTSPFLICLHGDEISVAAGGQHLRWYDSPDAVSSTDIAPRPSTSDTDRYLYYVSQTVAGCESGKASVLAIVEKCCGDELVVPSAFTPNGDGRNETFGLSNVAANISYHMRIYNRWGEQVFHGIKGDKWDGTEHGQPAPTGIYLYDIQVNCSNGNIIERKGDVLLVR